MNMQVTPAGKARATHHVGFSSSEVEIYLSAVESVFNKIWLESGDLNRIQKVWHRDDPLATLELLALGHAIVTMSNIDSAWVKGIARKVRTDGNKTHGWIFELIGAAMFAGAGMSVIPMPENFPAYDAEIRFADGYKMNVSFKSHGMSAHEKGFQDGCKLLRNIAANKFRGVTPSFCLRVTCTNHLEKVRMDAVQDWVRMLIGNIRRQDQRIDLGDTSMVWFAPIRGFQDIPLHPRYYSDTVQVFSRQHRREQLRFEKNIQEAEKKFSSITRESNSCNVVVMRVHSTANIELLATYARDLLNEPNCKVDAIWFYQPSVVRDINKTMLMHTLKPEIHPGRYGLGHQLKGKVLHGVISTKSSELQIIGPHMTIPMPDSYVFQQADHYSSVTMDALGAMNGIASAPAPGIRIHSVFDNLAGSVVLSGKFPDEDELLII
ncbi:hypothetical protein [Paraburkholderia tropica]|uniref:hypothetical protein n=1 Tax=Paraburkholderia tropica TaxID=92647 RepID=UPI002AB1EF69|nr:hypothetical protein [Paraburkholderia tropica]